MNAVPIVAATFEMCIAALDVFDEIEDGDESPLVDSIGAPRAMNVATALLAQSQAILATLASMRELANPASAFARALNESIVLATAGQDADLQASGNPDQTLEGAVQIARQKSGNLVAGASVLGAMVGTSHSDTLEKYRQFGLHFGTMAQIANDIHDVTNHSSKSDAARGNPTLPRLFVARASRSPVTEISGEEVTTGGGLHFSWVVFEIERRTCLKLLQDLEQAGQHVQPLQQMVKA